MDNIKKLLQSIEKYEKHFGIKAYYVALALKPTVTLVLHNYYKIFKKRY